MKNKLQLVIMTMVSEIFIYIFLSKIRVSLINFYFWKAYFFKKKHKFL